MSQHYAIGGMIVLLLTPPPPPPAAPFCPPTVSTPFQRDAPCRFTTGISCNAYLGAMFL